MKLKEYLTQKDINETFDLNPFPYIDRNLHSYENYEIVSIKQHPYNEGRKIITVKEIR